MRLVLLAASVLLALLAGSAAAAPHDPIVIEGDADLCDDEEGDGAVGQDDGIINCATADGSPDRPYVIAGWDVQLDASDRTHAAGGCPSVPAPAAVLVCDVTRHVVLRNMFIGVESGTVRATADGFVDPDGSSLALAVSGAHVRLEDSVVAAGGTAIAVLGRVGADTSLRMEAVDIRRPEETEGFFGAPDDDAPMPTIRETPVIEVRDADAFLDTVTIDATGRLVGILADGSKHASIGQTHAFHLRDSLVADAGSKGVELVGVLAEVSGSTFRGNGAAGATTDVLSRAEASSPAFDILVRGAGLRAERNHFEVVGTAITLEAPLPGLVRENVFLRHERAVVMPVAVQQAANAGCPAAVHYNSFDGNIVVNNRDASCFVDARFNWWGQGGPYGLSGTPAAQTHGDVLTEPWLKDSVERLAAVEAAVPPEGLMAHGQVTVTGTARSGPELPVRRVEASLDATDWQEAWRAEGTLEWRLQIDLAAFPPGPFTLWVRACDENECGVPRPVQVLVRGTSLEPVALLQADPMVVTPGATIMLDASGSFSPQGNRITHYDFGLGWQSEPVATMTASGDGPYPVALRVRDEAGLVSDNDASLTIHPLKAPSTHAMPALPALAPLAVLTAFAAAAARRRV